MEPDLDTFRADQAAPAVVATSPRRRSSGTTYLGGKPPMWWLQRAAARGKSALATGLALWFKRGLQGRSRGPIRVDATARRAMGLSQDQTSRGVHALEAAGLVKVHRGGRGRCAEVTIVEEFTDPSVASA